MDKPGLDSNAPEPGPGLDKNILPRDQAGTKSWESPGSRVRSRAMISTPCRDPDTNLSPAQTSGTSDLLDRGEAPHRAAATTANIWLKMPTYMILHIPDST